jgi:hypothetical protein
LTDFFPPPSNKERSRIAIAFLYFLIPLGFLGKLAKYLFFILRHRARAQFTFTFVSINFLFLIISLLSFIYFIMWLRRAYNNLHLLGSKNVSLKEGWAAGAWFVPIINLIWPYKIMREIWFETQSIFRGNQENISLRKFTIGKWWWGLNLISFIYIGLRLSKVIDFGNSPTEISVSLDIISTILNTIECFLLISIIRQISFWDEEMNQRLQNQQALSYEAKFSSENPVQ